MEKLPADTVLLNNISGVLGTLRETFLLHIVTFKEVCTVARYVHFEATPIAKEEKSEVVKDLSHKPDEILIYPIYSSENIFLDLIMVGLL